MKTRDELKAEFETNENDIIKNPGKFEGENLSTIFYYEIYLDGGSSGDGFIEIEPSDRNQFNNIPESAKYAQVCEDDNGFITVIFSDEITESDDYESYEDFDLC